MGPDKVEVDDFPGILLKNDEEVLDTSDLEYRHFIGQVYSVQDGSLWVFPSFPDIYPG